MMSRLMQHTRHRQDIVLINKTSLLKSKRLKPRPKRSTSLILSVTQVQIAKRGSKQTPHRPRQRTRRTQVQRLQNTSTETRTTKQQAEIIVTPTRLMKISDIKIGKRFRKANIDDLVESVRKKD